MIRALLQSAACAVAFVLFAPGVPFAAPPEPGLIASHTALPRSYPLLVQSPVDISLALLGQLATTDLQDCRKLFVVSYPLPGVERFVDLLFPLSQTPS